MEYKLFEKGNDAQAVASATFADDYAAEKWAIAWATANAKGSDYVLKSGDGRLTSALLRTVADQWYIVRTSLSRH